MSQPGAFVEQPGQPTTSDADGRAPRATSEGMSSMRKAGDAVKDYGDGGTQACAETIPAGTATAAAKHALFKSTDLVIALTPLASI